MLVEALERTGTIACVAQGIRAAFADSAQASVVSGTILALAFTLMNNLPAGLVASTAIAQAQTPQLVGDGRLIGVDPGPNLSITGSPATIMWRQAIGREGGDVGF